MGLTYNITDDYLYQEGLAKGEQKRPGRKKGADYGNAVRQNTNN